MQYQVTNYKKKYQAIIDIFNDHYKNREDKPNIYGNYIFSDKALLLLDMPSKEKNFHGSSYEFSCSKDICNISGQVVVNRNLEKETNNNLEKLKCAVTAIHKHPEEVMYMISGKEYEKESHIHFKCTDRLYPNTLDIARFLKNF